MEVCIKDKFWYLRMGRAMAKFDKVTVYKNGLTVQFMKANGTKTKLKVKVPSGTPKATSTLAIFVPIKPMVSVSTLTSTAAATRASGSTTFKKDKVKKFGLTVPNTSENIQME